jgi:hypothetical protein
VSGRDDRGRETPAPTRERFSPAFDRVVLGIAAVAAALALTFAVTWRSSPALRRSLAARGGGRVAAIVSAEAARLPEQIEHATASTTSELQPEDDLLALLAWLEPGRGPLGELVDDGARFSSLFASRHPERWIDAAPYRRKLRDAWIEGATLALEPGVWRLAGLDPPGVPLPEDATLAGAGISTTLIALASLRPAGDVARFTLRDCTVLLEDHPLLDLPHGFASVTFERVRFVGWDGGIGAAPLIRARGLAVRMVECELLGGYGGSPGSGSLFEVPSAALLARLERCRLAGVRTGIERWHAGASAAFVDCAARDVPDRPPGDGEDRPGVLLRRSVFRPLPDGARAPYLALDDLFPRWRERLE